MTTRKILLTHLRESPSNPRQTFGRIDELAANLKQMGVLQPLIVRSIDVADQFEIVCGHRRARAAKKAGLTEVPCEVRVLTDDQVIEIQLAENLQRQDIEPLEEAEAFDAMITRHGFTPEAISKKLGISDGTVYGRLKLLKLCPEARKAVADGVLPSSVAVPLARLGDESFQLRCLRELKQRFHYEGEPAISARDALEFIHRDFSRALRLASFDVKDSMLIEGAVACGVCPNNTKCAKPQPGLFDDFSKAERGQAICTDISCFDKKTAAAWAIKVAEFEGAGVLVLNTEVGHGLFRYSEQLDHASGYIELDTPNPSDSKKRTWRDAFEKLSPDVRPPLVVAPDRSFRPRHLVDEKLLMKAIADAPGAPKWARAEVERKEEIAQARENAKADSAARDLRKRVQVSALWKIGASESKVTEAMLRFVLAGLGARWVSDEIRDALNIDSMDEYEKLVTKGDAKALRIALLVWGAFAGDLLDGGDDEPAEWKRLVKDAGVDLKALEKQLLTSDESEKAIDAKKKKKGGKS